MSAGSRAESPSDPGDTSDFRPTASLKALRARAEMLRLVRAFFSARGVLEVETPVLALAGGVDRHLEPIRATCQPGSAGGRQTLYLLTSPELGMKRLLAAGSGPIYQMGRAFRDGESGRWHNPEFTILEWYRPGFDPEALRVEIEELVATVLEKGAPAALPCRTPFERLTYAQAFERELGIDPHGATIPELRAAASKAGVEPHGNASAGDSPAGAPTAGTAASTSPPPMDRDAWLDLLLVTCIEPKLGVERPTFILDYPASQAALARVRPGNPPVAERFELYVAGVELANGYHELLDATEQRKRFEDANRMRQADGRPPLPLDERFLAALEAGLPACSGVALGIDRLLMVALGAATGQPA